MAFLKGKRPGETYHQLVAVKDPSTGDYVLSRDDQQGNAEAIPVWVKMSNGEALKVQAADGAEVFVVDTLLNKAILNNLEIQGSVTNDKDAATKEYVDSSRGTIYTRFNLEDAVPTASGWQFTLPDSVVPFNGSVQVVINGVYYLSNSDQTTTDPDTDFHFSGSGVVVHNKDSGGTINLIEDDDIGIYYQKS